jgi:hypothetical protein
MQMLALEQEDQDLQHVTYSFSQNKKAATDFWPDFNNHNNLFHLMSVLPFF